MAYLCLSLAGLMLMVGVAMLWKMRQENKTDQEIDTTRRLAEGMELAEKLDHSMTLIPKGEFIQGSEALGRLNATSDETPQRKVYLDAFAIDTYEVTNAQYQRYVLTKAINPPRYWMGNYYPSGTADYPVVGIS